MQNENVIEEIKKENIDSINTESKNVDSHSESANKKIDCHESASTDSRNDNAAAQSNNQSSLRGEAEAIQESKNVDSHTQITKGKKAEQDYYFVPMQELPKTGFAAFKRSIGLSIGSDIIKGLGLTIKEFFSKPVTLNYPFESQPLSPRYRAVHNLQRMLESGSERCIGCGLCEKICTSNCIRILTHEGEDGRKKIDSYTINLGRCIYCGLCAEVCPELAIVMGNRFENASEQRAHFGLKEDFLKDMEEARFHNQLEFEGFGSVRPSADKEVKQTPLDY